MWTVYSVTPFCMEPTVLFTVPMATCTDGSTLSVHYLQCMHMRINWKWHSWEDQWTMIVQGQCLMSLVPSRSGTALEPSLSLSMHLECFVDSAQQVTLWSASNVKEMQWSPVNGFSFCIYSFLYFTFSCRLCFFLSQIFPWRVFFFLSLTFSCRVLYFPFCTYYFKCTHFPVEYMHFFFLYKFIILRIHIFL